MSHFTVLVVGPDVDAALYPFWELDLSEEEIQKDPRAVFEIEIGEGLEDASFFSWKDANRKFQEERKYPDAITWLDEYHGYQKGPGGWGYWNNPKSRWDWYQVGGRWSDFLISKTIGPCDSTRKRDVDWEAMQKKHLAEYNSLYDEYLIDEAEGKRGWYGWNGPEGKAREQYIAEQAGLSTFAVIKDGQWYEKGKMGWWACVSDEKEGPEWQATWQKIIDTVGDDEILTVVDCHI